MAGLTLLPFADEHLDDAARLLGERHARHRAAEPLLADSDAREALERAWRKDGVSGVVALRAGALAGYLIGRAATRQHFGDNVWIERAGHAAAEAETIRDLYAYAAERWAEQGSRLHYVYVPALAEELEPWRRLGFGFGLMHVDAIRETGSALFSADGVSIRRGSLADLETVALPHSRLIGDQQRLTPSFSSYDPDPEELRADWIETLEDEEVAFFVAEREGHAIGHSTVYPADPDLGTPEDAIYLASTAAVPDARGGGVGRALTAHVLGFAEENGHPVMVTNWRGTNLVASRFWPARGFRETYHRLYRQLGVG